MVRLRGRDHGDSGLFQRSFPLSCCVARSVRPLASCLRHSASKATACARDLPRILLNFGSDEYTWDLIRSHETPEAKK